MRKVYKTTFKLRRGNEENWKKNNPILQEGEPGFALDANILKIGDGKTRWLDLKAISSKDAISTPASAAVGQTIVVKAVDENGKPTKWTAADMPKQAPGDWSQNDETAPDYVKNRTHYTEWETVLEQSELDGFADMDGLMTYVLPYALNISARAMVEVLWDGNVYNLTAIGNGDNPMVAFGNLMILGMEDTGEPFAIVVNKDENLTVIVSYDVETSHTVGINAEKTVKIDRKFLPDNIAFLENGLMPVGYVFPKADDIFGNDLVVGGTFSTLAKPRPNKITLHNLTLETFNAMLDGTFPLPSHVMVGYSVAQVTVRAHESTIQVCWTATNVYIKPGYSDICGAHMILYDVEIHEDASNPGTIVSEYAMIDVVDAELK